MYATEILAGYLATYPSAALPPDISLSAVCCILDAVTAAVVGHDIPSVRAAREIARREFGPGPVPIWFTGECLGATAAAFCNAASVSALDFDDGHRAARGHPGAAVIPVALSVASAIGASTDDLLTAVALGYETGIRIAVAQNPQAIKSRQSGRWTGYAAVATAGRLYKSDPSALAHALAVAGVLAPNQEANGSSGYAYLTGNDVKEGIPWSVVTGLTALRLTEWGFTGPQDLLDHASHFARPGIIADLGAPTEISRVYFKLYSCCRYVHPALDALAALSQHAGIAPEQIGSIDVRTFQWALRLSNSVSPKTLTEIQYSLPYCLAIAVVDGPAALAPIGNAQLGRPDLCEIARKVRISVDREIDRRFPGETLAQLCIETTNGRMITSEVTSPRGDRLRPLSWDDLVDKFCAATRSKLSSKAQNLILQSLQALKTGDAAPLLRCVRMRLFD
ncbi:MmgE/PrpD family protein [Sinorhizobium terangae]|uniref:MmgE/PrpD family protein n=1 Tax=Sinorhizobium terangae TaxID=110322 RepID=UPI0024B0BC34|nr:MmgE/PrpD family protein [Sinorhizobium terangae]WFU50195.1 MmgE/PrpD family protein [Sinorhizobium terangae]